ncbi:probable G-protein coupled receptor 146 [Anguilla rostrata]|uniref:probable G-protein coupled receptor 146 n=1 Tax=Anguilla rostrata TaxID=7938 RepID=UPI0030CE0D7E
MWSCVLSNETDDRADQRLCQDLGLALSVLSLAYLLVCFPTGLCYNALLVAVNLSNKVSMTMPDVYFVNMAVAGLLLGALAPVELLGPAYTRWPAWDPGNEVFVGLLILFDVCALVTMYSTALLSLDYYIERALPHTYMSSVYNTKHVCGFLWGGAALTSFSSLLFHVCGHASAKMAECAKMRDKEAADGIMMLVGYAVPAAAVLYALALVLRIRREAASLEPDPGSPDPAAQRLLLASVCAQFLLWTPYYAGLLAHAVSGGAGALPGRPRGSTYHFLRRLAQLLAFSSSFVTPLVYRLMSRDFSHKLRRLLRRLPGRKRGCGHAHDPAAAQQVVT